MNKSTTYYDFLHDVYERIDVATLYDWTKSITKTNKGILRRFDYAIGAQFDVNDDGVVVPRNNDYTIEVESGKTHVAVNKNGLLPILKDCAYQYKESHLNNKQILLLLSDIINSCKVIKEVLFTYMLGKQSLAFQILDKHLTELDNKNHLNTYEMVSGKYTYRMRNKTSSNDLFTSSLDLFHIPFNLRNVIKSYRYSIPGYPCLYVAESLYSCWEEMRRPNLDNFFYVGIRNLEDINLLDLRIRRNLTKQEEIERYLRMLPFIMACSMQVQNGGDVFVPEYIVPQGISKWLLKMYRISCQSGMSKPYMGVAYTSAMEDVWFEFTKTPNEYQLADNMALLTYIRECDVLKQTYCPYLSGMLEITLPHCYEYEYIKNTAEFFNKAFKREHYGIEEVVNYKNSYLSFLEERLKKSDEWTRVVNVIRKNGK